MLKFGGANLVIHLIQVFFLLQQTRNVFVFSHKRCWTQRFFLELLNACIISRHCSQNNIYVDCICRSCLLQVEICSKRTFLLKKTNGTDFYIKMVPNWFQETLVQSCDHGYYFATYMLKLIKYKFALCVQSFVVLTSDEFNYFFQITITPLKKCQLQL